MEAAPELTAYRRLRRPNTDRPIDPRAPQDLCNRTKWALVTLLVAMWPGQHEPTRKLTTRIGYDVKPTPLQEIMRCAVVTHTLADASKSVAAVAEAGPAATNHLRAHYRHNSSRNVRFFQIGMALQQTGPRAAPPPSSGAI